MGVRAILLLCAPIVKSPTFEKREMPITVIESPISKR